MFRSTAYSAKNFPGGRRDGRAFQEFRHVIADEQKNAPHAVEADKCTHCGEPNCHKTHLLPMTPLGNGYEVIQTETELVTADPYHDHHQSIADDDGMANHVS